MELQTLSNIITEVTSVTFDLTTYDSNETSTEELANWTTENPIARTTPEGPIEYVATPFEETLYVWLWSTVPMVLLIVGLVGNGLTLIVIYRLGVKGQPTLVFLVFLAVSDCLVLITGLPRYWISYVFDYDIREISNITCKLYYFFIYLFMQYSSWILVGVSLERVAKTYIPFTYKRLYSNTKVAVGLSVTFVFLCVINGHFFFTNGINEYTEGDCGSLNDNFFHFDEHIFVYVDFFLLSLIPFVIMLISGILLVRILRIAKKNRESMMHKSVYERANRFSVRMTKMLVVCTIYFIIATAPISIYFILDTYLYPIYEEEDNTVALARMDLAWTVTYLIQFSNYCVNFYLYTASNRRFYREMRSLLCCGNEREESSMYRVHSERQSENSEGIPDTEETRAAP